MTMAANLTNHFLIAMPGLQDPNFQRTVTYLCEHSAQGAMGIVVNRPMDLNLGDILEQMQIPVDKSARVDQPVFIGGPVATDRGFVLHASNRPWNSTLQIAQGISVTTSRDILEEIAKGSGPQDTLIALGYAGWAGGQLEQELSTNAWLSGPADLEIIFGVPAQQRWKAAAMLLGVDLDQISTEIGHA